MNKIFFLITFLLFTDLTFPQNSGWIPVNSGTTLNLNAVHSLFETTFVVGDSGIILKSIDFGQTWQAVQSPTLMNLNDVKIQTVNSILVIGDGGLIILSTDGGNHWQFIPSGVTEDLLSLDVYDGSGLIGGKSQTILYSYLQWGTQWEIRQTGLLGGEFSSVYLTLEGEGYVGGDNSISQALVGKTTNSDFNWNFIPFYLNGNEGKITDIDFIWWGIDTAFASAVLWDGRGAISKSTDNGNTWVTSIFDLPLNALTIPQTDSLSKGYAVGDSGTIIKSYNLGESWYQQQSGTNDRLNDVNVYWWYTDTLIVVGDNGTILVSTSGGEPVSEISSDDTKPTYFSLAQNYPNPFNPSTKIKFTTHTSPYPSPYQGEGKRERFHVSLKVYDILGNEVATLVNEELSSGEYEAEFAPESSIEHLASGIYFYTLKAGDFLQTKKMILLK